MAVFLQYGTVALTAVIKAETLVFRFRARPKKKKKKKKLRAMLHSAEFIFKVATPPYAA
jgi:hypothetical protein